MRLLLTLLFFCFINFCFAQTNVFDNKTEIIKTKSGFQLLRNGEPYYVRGGGGTEHLEVLKNIGGNSIRTWSTENAQQVLDDALKNGLTVCMGLWVGHERHGFDYNDEYAIEAQLKGFEQE
jgi:hypothetical protein